MSCKILRIYFVVAGLLLFTHQFARADDSARLLGSYRVIHTTDLGQHTRVQLQLHLVNHGPSELHIQRITLWDSSHPERAGSEACSIVVRTGASIDTTQEFTISRAEYEMWKRGARPRLVLEIGRPGERQTTKVVRLDPISAGKGN